MCVCVCVCVCEGWEEDEGGEETVRKRMEDGRWKDGCERITEVKRKSGETKEGKKFSEREGGSKE